MIAEFNVIEPYEESGMNRTAFSRRSIILVVIVALLVVVVPVSAMSFDRKGGFTYATGGGVTSEWDGNRADGTVKSRVVIQRSWFNFTGSYGKSQAAVCKRFWPSFTGDARISMTAVLNGELRTESKSFWKVPGGQANADVQLFLQTNRVITRGLMFVGSQFWLPHSYTFNNQERSFEITQRVTKGVSIEVCAGIMTNASVIFGGGNATADFMSGRFQRSYIKSLTLSKK